MVGVWGEWVCLRVACLRVWLAEIGESLPARVSHCPRHANVYLGMYVGWHSYLSALLPVSLHFIWTWKCPDSIGASISLREIRRTQVIIVSGRSAQTTMPQNSLGIRPGLKNRSRVEFKLMFKLKFSSDPAGYGDTTDLRSVRKSGYWVSRCKNGNQKPPNSCQKNRKSAVEGEKHRRYNL